MPPIAPTLTPPATAVLAAIEPRREKRVQAGKVSETFDVPVQGATLRIEATGTPFDPATYQAVIFDLTSAASSTVSAEFRKAGRHIDAMRFTGRKMASGCPGLDLGRLMATPATLHIPIALAG